MDEHDERLARWFDREFYPLLGKEHYFAKRMAQQKELGQANMYWVGYFAAVDMLNETVEDALAEIRDSVEGADREDTDDD